MKYFLVQGYIGFKQFDSNWERGTVPLILGQLVCPLGLQETSLFFGSPAVCSAIWAAVEIAVFYEDSTVKKHSQQKGEEGDF